MQNKYGRQIIKGILIFCFIIFFGISQEIIGLTAASSVGEDIMDISGNNVANIITSSEEMVSNNNVVYLQVPNDIDFVIDPWQVAKRGQVYSEKYVIRNCGTKEGTLYLTNIVCYPEKSENIVIVKDRNLISDNGEKSIFMEMMFDNGEVLVLSQEEKQYSIKIAPKSEIVFWVIGNINVKAEDEWRNNDVKISMKYHFSIE